MKNSLKKLKTWRPIHLCWLFKKKRWKIPKCLSWLIGDPATIFEDSFNSYNDGDLNGQGGWSGNAVFDVQGTTVKEGAKAVQYANLSTQLEIVKDGTARTDGSIGMYLRKDGTITQTGYGGFQIGQGTTWICGVQLSPLVGKIQIETTGGTYDILASGATIETWYWVQVDWESVNHKVRASVNGGTPTDWYSSNSWTTGINRVHLWGNALQAGDVLYFDYIAENPYSAPTTYTVTVSDTMALTDTITKPATYKKTFADTFGLTDIITKLTTYKKTIIDTFSLTDIVSAGQKFILIFADAFNLTDAISALKGFFITVADTIFLIDHHPYWGYAGSFDGVNDYVDCGTASGKLSNTSDHTVELWVKGNAAASSHKIPIVLGNKTLLVSTYLNKITTTRYINSKDYSSVSTSTYNWAVWHHLVLVYDGTTLYDKIYMDGVDVTTPWNNFWILYVTDKMLIGTHFSTPTFGWNGLIDEVRIYNRALSAEEIAEHYKAVFRNETGLVGHWNFNEGTGTLVADTSGQGNNGTAVGGMAWRDIGNPQITTKMSWYKTFADTISLTDVIFAVRVFLISIADTVGLTDAITKLTTYKKTISDTLNLTDAITKLTTFKKTISDSISLSDIVSAGRRIVVNVMDTINLTDTISKLTKYFRTISDTLHLTDVVSIVSSAWTWAEKHVSDWTHPTKHTSTFNYQNKSSSPTWSWKSKSERL